MDITRKLLLQETARGSHCCKRQHEKLLWERRGLARDRKKNVVELEKDIDENGDEDPEGK